MTHLFIQRLGVEDLELQPTKTGRRISERTLRHYETLVAALHEVPVREVIGRSYYPAYVQARQDLMWRLRKLGYTYPEIGRAMGGRDHNTVQLGCRKHAERAGLAHETPKRQAAAQLGGRPA